jgi:hypothetical protein
MDHLYLVSLEVLKDQVQWNIIWICHLVNHFLISIPANNKVMNILYVFIYKIFIESCNVLDVGDRPVKNIDTNLHFTSRERQ